MVLNVLPSNGNVNGKDLKYFIKKYWQAVCPIPKKDNPIWDNDGSKDESFNAKIKEDLFMLSPSMRPQTPLTRNIKVPNGKGLFIPVVPVEVSKCETNLPLVATARKDQNSIVRGSLVIEIKHGNNVTPAFNLDDYNFAPFDIGSVNFPSPTTEAVFSIINPLKGNDSCEAVAAGRYVWTEPLRAGETYTIRYGGNIRCTPSSDCVETTYDESITYKITG